MCRSQAELFAGLNRRVERIDRINRPGVEVAVNLYGLVEDVRATQRHERLPVIERLREKEIAMEVRRAVQRVVLFDRVVVEPKIPRPGRYADRKAGLMDRNTRQLCAVDDDRVICQDVVIDTDLLRRLDVVALLSGLITDVFKKP